MNGIRIQLGLPKWDLVPVPQELKILQNQRTGGPCPGGQGGGIRAALSLAEGAVGAGTQVMGREWAPVDMKVESPRVPVGEAASVERKEDTETDMLSYTVGILATLCQYGSPAGGGINWETGMDIYTLLYIKLITNKDLL